MERSSIISKYSDHTTVGGQVLAHRVRMMSQNWKVVWIVGRVSFLLSFVVYHMFKWNIHDIWNYLCIAKAVYRNGMTMLSRSLFSSSYFWFTDGTWKEFSDYTIATNQAFLNMKLQFEDSLIFCLSLAVIIGIASMVLMVIFNKYFGKSLSDNRELISGHNYVDAKVLKKSIKHKSDITLADISYPKDTESRHTILTGTTGSGKTNVMIELLDQITTKNEKIVIVDTVGTFINKYYKEERDVILNPLADDSVSWSFLSECRIPDNNQTLQNALIKNVSECLIEIKSNSNYDSHWDKAARNVFVETSKKALKEGKTTSELLDILLKIPLEEIEKYLKDTYAQMFVDQRADKMALSVRTTLANAISVFDVLKESSDNFSIREWISSNESGILFLSCKPVERATLIPLITSWLSMASESLMHTSPSIKRKALLKEKLGKREKQQ